jgi:hypothetical protein
MFFEVKRKEYTIVWLSKSVQTSTVVADLPGCAFTHENIDEN